MEAGSIVATGTLGIDAAKAIWGSGPNFPTLPPTSGALNWLTGGMSRLNACTWFATVRGFSDGPNWLTGGMSRPSACA